MIIGHAVLTGKIEELKRPIVVFRKNSIANGNDDTTNDTNQKPDISYGAESLVRKKLVFRMRPRPFVTANSAA